MEFRDTLHIFSIISGLTGSWFLAFGLKVKEGISKELRKELKLSENLIAPSDVQQNTKLICWGLALISLAGVIEIVITLFLIP